MHKYLKNNGVLSSSYQNRDNKLKIINSEIEDKKANKKQIKKVSRSLRRVAGVFICSFIVSFPIVLAAKPYTLKDIDKLYSLLIMFIAGLPLLHSFINGWTISRHGVVNVIENEFSFTIVQLFYSFVFCLTLLFTIVRWS